MARPLKNNADYFPHDAGMRNHKKVKAIRSKFGIQGYGIWSMILEHLTGSDGNVFPYTDLEFELMSGDFGVSATEIRQVVDYCITMEMLFNEKGFVKSESLDERLAPVYEKRQKSKELSKQQLRANGKFVANNTEPIGKTVTETPQRKGKESTVNEKEIIQKVSSIIKYSSPNTSDLNYMVRQWIDQGHTNIVDQILAMKAYYAKQKIIFPTKIQTLTESFMTSNWIEKLKELEPEQQEKIKQNGKQHRAEPDIIGSSAPGSLG